MTRGRVRLFDLDNTLHDASHAAFAPISEAMNGYIAARLGVDAAAAALRQHHWKRYGATLLGSAPPANAANAGALAAEVGVHRCRKPLYVYAKIKSLHKLLRVR